MNIVFHRYNSICEPDFIEAFHKLGIEVIEDRGEMTDKNIPLEDRVERLTRLVLERQPVFVFSINFFPYISMICEKLHVLYVAVSVDCPVTEIYSREIKNTCNRIFLFDRVQYESIVSENPSGIFHLPLGANAERIDRTLEERCGKMGSGSSGTGAEAAQGGYRYDVSFVGSLYKEKDPYLDYKGKLAPWYRGFFDGLVQAQLKVPGQSLIEETVGEKQISVLRQMDSGFYPSDYSVHDISHFVAVNHYLSPHVTYLERVRNLNLLAQYFSVDFFTRSDTSDLKGVHCHGGVSSLTEMPEVFRRSKINLNMTLRSIQTGLPQRIWDVLACRGFLLTNYQAELPDCFVIGQHLEAYETPAEMAEKIDYYLKHEEEREEIAEAGYLYVKEHATVEMRVAQMIRIIMEGMEACP